MGNSPNKRTLIARHYILFIILTSLTIFACFNIDNFLTIYRAIFMDALRFRYPSEMGDYDEILYFTFEPNTILPLVGQGKKNLFQPIPDLPDDVAYPLGTFLWRQQDYLKVSNALYHQFAHHDTLAYWMLYRWYFDRNCDDNPVGFDLAELAYFNSYTDEHTAITIAPLAKVVEWGKNEKFESPSFWGWKSIDPAQIKITADDALQIAEIHGGEKARLAVQNQCIISVSLYANTNLWEVNYYNSSVGNDFEMTIDPYYGNYNIIKEK